MTGVTEVPPEVNVHGMSEQEQKDAVHVCTSQLPAKLKVRNEALQAAITQEGSAVIGRVVNAMSGEIAPAVDRMKQINESTAKNINVWQEQIAMMVEALGEVDEYVLPIVLRAQDDEDEEDEYEDAEDDDETE